MSVVGAGPAGLVAAINLAKVGYRVTVYEKKNTVGARFKGDFEGLENWTSEENVLDSLARMNIKPTFPYSTRYGHRIFDSDLHETVVTCDRPLYYLIRRGSAPGTLDSNLRQQAVEAGVTIALGKTVDTAPSPTDERRIVSGGPGAAVASGRGIVFDTTMPDMSLAILDDRIAPKAYAYLLTWNGRGTLVTCMFRDFKNGRHYFRKALERFQEISDLQMTNVKKYGGFITFSIRKTNVQGNNLYVGEAAGFQDYLWGFGIRYAMKSGYLAARSIIEDSDYDTLWKKEFSGLLKASVSNRFLFELGGNNGYKRLIKRISKDPFRISHATYTPSLLKKLVYPLAKLKYRRIIE